MNAGLFPAFCTSKLHHRPLAAKTSALADGSVVGGLWNTCFFRLVRVHVCTTIRVNILYVQEESLWLGAFLFREKNDDTARRCTTDHYCTRRCAIWSAQLPVITSPPFQCNRFHSTRRSSYPLHLIQFSVECFLLTIVCSFVWSRCRYDNWRNCYRQSTHLSIIRSRIFTKSYSF